MVTTRGGQGMSTGLSTPGLNGEDGAREMGGDLWDAAARAFHGPILRRAIVARAWTPEEFARATRLHPGSIYNALQGRPVRDATAIRIFEALEKRQPMSLSGL